MEINYIQLAIPFFFAAIAIEALYSALTQKGWYDLHDALANLSCGSVEQIIELVYKGLIFAVYIMLYQHTRVASIPIEAPLAWGICFILVDFGYYWYHRASHRIHLLWAGHGPHHQSEEYNLTVALRQGAFERSASWLFWLPLALLGFPPIMYLACLQFNNIYQFFLHTRAVKSLGPLEYIFNTPSHHRVHHGKNPLYIDKNYGGTLIIWDRIFGTFEAESEEPVYGTVSPLRSWNPVWANGVFYADMGRYMRGLPLKQKLEVLLRPPGWHPDQPEPEIPAVDALSYKKYRTPQNKALNLLLGLRFVLTLLAATVFLEQVKHLPISLGWLAGTALALSFVSAGALAERKSWFWTGELCLLPLTAALIWLLPLANSWQLAGTGLIILLAAASFYLYKNPAPTSHSEIKEIREA